jgi:transposase
VPHLPAAPADEKKKTLRAAERDQEAIRAERAAFLERVRGLDPTRLVFVDEAGVTTAMVRTFGRAPRGERAYGTAPAGTWRRLTVLGALAAGGVAGAMSIERATDTAVFLAYLDRVLIPELRTARPDAVVVMDNLSPHRAPAVRQRLEAAGFELLLLPRYAPELNPIEAMWSKLKGLLRAAAARTAAALEAALADALARVTPSDARGWFRHCGYALPAN